MKIYIAEDDPLILYGFIMMVENCGHQVIGQATDGETAVKQILELQPDLVIMDISMPKTDGVTAIEKVNKENVIPCIIVSGYKDEAQIERAAKAGVYAYLHKPVDEYALQAEINIVMQRYRDYAMLEEDRDQAHRLLEERKVIERAKGIIMKQTGVCEEDAYRSLQKKSRNRNVKLIDMAYDIIKAYDLLQ